MNRLTSRLPAGLLRQGLRYVLVGATTTLFYLLATLLLADVAGLPFELALALGFSLGLCLHFTLQRLFVWTHHDREYALPFHHQVGRYLLLAGTQYGITAASVALLPAALGLPVEVVYVAMTGLTVSANFLLFRHGIFHPAPQATLPVAPSIVKIT